MGGYPSNVRLPRFAGIHRPRGAQSRFDASPLDDFLGLVVAACAFGEALANAVVRSTVLIEPSRHARPYWRAGLPEASAALGSTVGRERLALADERG